MPRRRVRCRLGHRASPGDSDILPPVNARPPWLRIALTALVGGAVFALISTLEVATGPLGNRQELFVGGLLSIAAWVLMGLYLRAGPLAAAGIGAWTGLVAVAISFAAVQREHIPPMILDGSRIPLVAAESFVIWPFLGAVVCTLTDLTHRSSAGIGCLALAGIAIGAVIAAFWTAAGLH
jgi:hypothetical protein